MYKRQDVLSDYVELPDNRMNYTVTATKGGVTTNITREGTVQVQYHADTKTVTAAFKSGFVLDKDTVYAVNFEVKPTQKAYDEYADQNGCLLYTSILRSEMAYELGGDNLPAIGSQMLTADAALVSGDEIWLYGKDLPQIQKNTAFARFALVRVKEDIMGEGDALYNQIRRLEYTKYHMYPEGYMMRISAASEREMVRIEMCIRDRY